MVEGMLDVCFLDCNQMISNLCGIG